MMREIAVVINNANQNVTPEETIKAVKEAGFKSVFLQWYNEKWNFSQEQQLTLARSLGLNIVFIHLGYQGINNLWLAGKKGEELIEGYKNDIKLAKENNIPMVIMHLTSGKQAPSYNEIGLKRIQTLCNYAERLGIKVAFENTKIKGYLEYVLSNIHNPNVGICYDSGHCHVHFKDEFPYELYTNKILATHLHDNDQSDDLHLLPFDGTINWPIVMQKLKDCHYTGPITLELCYRYDYLNLPLVEFYQKGYQAAEKLAKLMDKNS